MNLTMKSGVTVEHGLAHTTNPHPSAIGRSVHEAVGYVTAVSNADDLGKSSICHGSTSYINCMNHHVSMKGCTLQDLL